MKKLIKKFLFSERDSDCLIDNFKESVGEKDVSDRSFSLKTERKGFAISFEIMMTMLLVTVMTTMTLYVVELYQTQRYFSDVTSATCTMAARYGGNDSKAYRIQVPNGGTIQQNAQNQLDFLNTNGASSNSGGLFDAEIYVANHPDDQGNVRVELEYNLKDYGWVGYAKQLGLFGERIKQTFEIPSLVQNGKLTGVGIS